jgi:hypothetical protein
VGTVEGVNAISSKFQAKRPTSGPMQARMQNSPEEINSVLREVEHKPIQLTVNIPFVELLLRRENITIN